MAAKGPFSRQAEELLIVMKKRLPLQIKKGYMSVLYC